MKYAILTCASLAIIAFSSCTSKNEPEVEQTETIVVERTVPAKPQPEEKGTSLSVDKNGVAFSKKDGDTEIDIDLKDK